jgi:hypothetical protein
MNQGYAKERLDLLASLLADNSEVAHGRIWTLQPASLRFKHGETIAELKVPYHMGADDETCVENAIVALMALLKKRHEPMGSRPVDQTPQAITSHGSAPSTETLRVLPHIPTLKDRTFLGETFTADSLEKRIATEILSYTSGFDCPILAAWLAPGGYGTAFIRWVEVIFEKALKDQAKNGWCEPTSYMLLMSTVNTIKKKKAVIKNVRISGLSYDRLDRSLGIALFVAFRQALAELLDRLRNSGVSYYNPVVATQLTSALVPRSFLAIPSNILTESLNPYGLNTDTYEAVKPYGMDFSEGVESVEKLVKATVKAVKGGGSALLEKIRMQHAITRVRNSTVEFLMEFDQPGTAAQKMLHEIYGKDRIITNLLSDQKHADELARALDQLKSSFKKDTRSHKKISEFEALVSGHKKSRLGGLFHAAKKDEGDPVTSVITSFYACLFDDHVDRFESLMRGYLADRRGEYDGKMLKDEYNKGRLYRFSADERPIIKTLEHEEEGQLFVDMKDFTRKTLKVKEIAMADFMKEYFYRPILAAADRYSVGTGVATDERGITLTNLPGDAAIFSGGVTYLVHLARDIQRVIQRYRDNLDLRLPPRKDEEIIAEVHRRFEGLFAALKVKRSKLNKALDRKEKGLESSLIALGEEEHRLANTYREELSGVIKGELEAGLYISFGAKAETMVIEGKEGFTGPVTVTIGEKINESARGTYRNALVRTKLEILLEDAKRASKNENLIYPFDIYIDRIYALRIPPELETPFEKLITNRKPAGAEAMTRIMANEFLGDLKKIISGEAFTSLRLISSTTDLYNKGHAISLEALYAYMKENKGTTCFFKKTVPLDSLNKAILNAFFIPHETLSFWFGVKVVNGTEQIELFYKSGEVIFKGFESNNPTEIFEMINPEGDFFKMLVKHHFHRWHEEAKQAPEGVTF